MATYQSEIEQIRDAVASIWRDIRTRLSFLVGRRSVPTPPGEWTRNERYSPSADTYLSFDAPWGTAYVAVRYDNECGKWWAKYLRENTFSEAISGYVLLNTRDYDQSYEDAIQAALDFMHGDHPKYPDDRPRPE